MRLFLQWVAVVFRGEQKIKTVYGGLEFFSLNLYIEGLQFKIQRYIINCQGSCLVVKNEYRGMEQSGSSSGS